MYENNQDKVIAYTRGEFLFVFNFNPVSSFTDYGIPVQGRYRIILDSDDEAFGGFNRIDRSSIYLSIRKSDKNIISTPLYLYLYLPARTGIVFKNEPVSKATDI